MVNWHKDSSAWNGFDTENGAVLELPRGIVLDRTLGYREVQDPFHSGPEYTSLAEAWAKSPYSDWLLQLLSHHLKSEHDHPLRLFGCWCARQVLPLVGDHAERCRSIVGLAERLSTGGKATQAQLEAAWNGLRPTAVPAGSVGIRHRSPSAAAVLACWRTCNPKAFEAARWVSFYATVAVTWDACGKTGEYEARRDVDAFLGKWARERGDVGLKTVDVEATMKAVWQPSWDEAARKAEREILTAQADKLRELLGNPFSPGL